MDNSEEGLIAVLYWQTAALVGQSSALGTFDTALDVVSEKTTACRGFFVGFVLVKLDCYLMPAAAFSAAALSVRSHENSGSSRPKCPYAAVF